MKVDEELKLYEILCEQDKQNKNIKMLVYDKEANNSKSDKYVISNEIVCPICKEKAFINVGYNKMDIFNCKNNHYTNGIKFEDFEDTQKINISKIFCDFCDNKDKGNIYNNELFKCLDCKKNLCPMCKAKHDSSHKIINYDDKDFICENHNEQFICYCSNCKENLCASCKEEHNEHQHNFTNYENLLSLERDKEFEKCINDFGKEIYNIIGILQDIVKKLRTYEKIYCNFWEKSNNAQKRNYETLLNKTKFDDFNRKLKNYIDFIKSEQLITKIQKILDLDNQMNPNYQISKIETKINDVTNLIPLPDGKYIIHSTIDYNYVWDEDVNCSNLTIFKRHGDENQKFIFKHIGEGFYTIKCAQSGRFVDCEKGSKDNQTNVCSYEYNNTNNQIWRIYPEAYGRFSFQSSVDDYRIPRRIDLWKALANNGNNIWLYGTNRSNAQMWIVEPV